MKRLSIYLLLVAVSMHVGAQTDSRLDSIYTYVCRLGTSLQASNSDCDYNNKKSQLGNMTNHTLSLTTDMATAADTLQPQNHSARSILRSLRTLLNQLTATHAAESCIHESHTADSDSTFYIIRLKGHEQNMMRLKCARHAIEGTNRSTISITLEMSYTADTTTIEADMPKHIERERKR